MTISLLLINELRCSDADKLSVTDGLLTGNITVKINSGEGQNLPELDKISGLFPANKNGGLRHVELTD